MRSASLPDTRCGSQADPGRDPHRKSVILIPHGKRTYGALFVILLIALFAFLAPVCSGREYYATDMSLANIAPCRDHWFGTDQLGRDLWTRVWVGTRMSIIIGVSGAILPQLIGLLIGSFSGMTGGWVDSVLMGIVDVGICIPSLVYITLISFFLGSGPQTVILAIAISNWMESAKLVRSRVIQYKNREFVLAAKTQGASNLHIVFRHILPNIMGQTVISTIAAVPNAIFAEAYLSFIGLGILSPNTSLGQLCKTGISLYRVFPYQLLFPGLIISILSLAFFIFGNTVRDALDLYDT